jgi:hypothetical protein
MNIVAETGFGRVEGAFATVTNQQSFVDFLKDLFRVVPETGHLPTEARIEEFPYFVASVFKIDTGNTGNRRNGDVGSHRNGGAIGSARDGNLRAEHNQDIVADGGAIATGRVSTETEVSIKSEVGVLGSRRHHR